MHLLYDMIRKGDYRFHEEFWSEVSAEAKDFIRSFMTVDHDLRATARGALQDRWIVGDDDVLSRRSLSINLEEFKRFNAKRKFHGAVHAVCSLQNQLHSVHVVFFRPLENLTFLLLVLLTIILAI